MATSSKGVALTNAHHAHFEDESIPEGLLLSAGFRVSNLTYISGQKAVKENRGIVDVGGFVAQIHQKFANIR
jgi:enamine deaminase RidA (YjgF/YER057c/UK114 family)